MNTEPLRGLSGPEMIQYREAKYEDRESIAALHAHSWRIHYRGAYRDHFLDTQVEQERRDVWEGRLSAPSPNQFVVLAEERGSLAGFACAYGGDDDQWGTLLDNIHVHPESQRRGIGTRLIQEVANWCSDNYPDDGLYLWVLSQNEKAQRFYQGIGAVDQGAGIIEPPGGGEVSVRRYAWPKLTNIVKAAER